MYYKCITEDNFVKFHTGGSEPEPEPNADFSEIYRRINMTYRHIEGSANMIKLHTE